MIKNDLGLQKECLHGKKEKQPKKKCVISSEARTHEHLASLELYGYVNFQLNKTDHLTLKMATAEIVERSVASNTASQYCSHQVITFNQGMLLLGSTHFLRDVLNLTGAICLLLFFLYLLHYALIKKAQELGVIPR
ncbi:uncharacterized protein LOC141894143 [Acropora palmata]|uniref:uncharacterized protein LOC141894143 n=1 Tax=Acropora palmata TaxID=6131 RepID=UPI003DA14DCA